MTGPTSIEPQPCIDTVVMSAVTGSTGRRTEHTGSVWDGERPDLGGFMVVNRTATARIAEPCSLPDSLPYRTDLVSSALIACSVAIESAVAEDHQLVNHRAVLVADPRNPSVSWLQLELAGMLRAPVAVSYRVDVLVPPEAVVAGDAGAA
jgi:hypothetical protein